MNPFGYSEPVWRLFRETPRAGVIEGPAVTGSATTRAGSGRLRLQVRVESHQVSEARFQAYGCPTTIAVGAWLAERAMGRGLAELAALRAADIRQALEIPEDKLHCALLGEDAIKSLCRSAS
jgi:NifU-like protein involved in Fe-S cluster formation